jgi:hypothetical protein
MSSTRNIEVGVVNAYRRATIKGDLTSSNVRRSLLHKASDFFDFTLIIMIQLIYFTVNSTK